MAAVVDWEAAVVDWVAAVVDWVAAVVDWVAAVSRLATHSPYNPLLHGSSRLHTQELN